MLSQYPSQQSFRRDFFFTFTSMSNLFRSDYQTFLQLFFLKKRSLKTCERADLDLHRGEYKIRPSSQTFFVNCDHYHGRLQRFLACL